MYFATEVWKKARKIVYANVPFYYYRYNPLSASYTLGEKKIKDRIIASVHAWEWIVDNCPMSKAAMFDLCFGAYVSAYLNCHGKEKNRVHREYKAFCDKYSFIKRNQKSNLFRYFPKIYVMILKLKDK